VRQRCKNEVHAVLMRNLKGRPPMTDVFGKRGRVWLSELELPRDERETVDGCVRQIDFFNEEVAILEREIAQHALASPDIKRLMTVPGVSLMTAATFMAAVGDIDRFHSPSKLVSYLGLDPKVRQSGSEPARHGRISKQGPAPVRGMLTEAAVVAVNTDGPMRAFYQRVRARRGNPIAIVAVARKLAVLFWHLLKRDEDYAFARPSLTRHKLRELELRAGAERHPGHRNLANNSGYHQQNNRDRDREFAAQAELAYRRLVADWTATGPAKVGAGATPGRASNRPSKGKAARQTTSP
jgi:transposase